MNLVVSKNIFAPNGLDLVSAVDAKVVVTETEIKSAMDLVVEKNIFAPNGGNIVATVEAKVVVTDTTEYDLVL